MHGGILHAHLDKVVSHGVRLCFDSLRVIYLDVALGCNRILEINPGYFETFAFGQIHIADVLAARQFRDGLAEQLLSKTAHVQVKQEFLGLEPCLLLREKVIEQFNVS